MNTSLAAILLAALALTPIAANADREHGRGKNKDNPFAPIDVAGMGTLSGERITSGTFTIVGFALDETAATPTLQAIGILTARSASHGITNQTVRVPVLNGATLPAKGGIGAQQVTPPACDVLNLVLGPLHLDLLGLVVDLNQVVLDLTAQPGAGNLLGNLLCGILGLLDLPGAIAAVTQLLGNLNTLLALLAV
jgi:hypothetical protein